MKTSDNGIKQIKLREGEILHGYLDSKGLLTIGVGHLVKKGEFYRLHQTITLEESTRLLRADLKHAEDAVNSIVKVPLTQNQFDALISFVINVGTNGFQNSTVVRKLNLKQYDNAANAFMLWCKPKEITGRRITEKKQFLTPDAKSVSEATATVPTLAESPATNTLGQLPASASETILPPSLDSAIEQLFKKTGE